MKKWPVAVALGALAAYAAWLWWPAPNPAQRSNKDKPATPVTTLLVSKQALTQTIKALGTLQAREGVTITSQQSGIIEQIHFRDGDSVVQNALLVTLHDDEERAKWQEAQAKLADAARQLERLQSLSSDKAVSRSSIEDKQAAVAIAQAQVDVAKVALDKRYIRAPFAGVLGAREVSPGALVTPGTAITTLDDISLVRVEFSLPENAAGQLRKGMKVAAHSAAFGDTLFNGVITHIDTRINPETRSLQARAEIQNSKGELKPGMLLELQLSQDDAPVLAVPEGALISLAEKHFVLVVDGEQNAHQIEILIGRRRVGFVEVLSGLNEGDRVIVEGTHKVRDGQKVTTTGS